tara:strand:- start:85 stop:741 length:657 start_codon:yes stop_codon:yes gene_type:complete
MKYKVSIAPEGYLIVKYALVFCIITFVISESLDYNFFNLLNLLSFSLFFVTCYFFRDPQRHIKPDNHLNLLSPADGKIISISKFNDNEMGESIKVAIFLSFFDVHRQWVPIKSKVIKTNYNPGKFFGAFMNKASERNEQTSILFNDVNKNSFKVKQIAGFVARRIVNHMNPADNVNQGVNLGFIRFGSRVEIILPKTFKLKVKKGMRVSGCKTIIGNF